MPVAPIGPAAAPAVAVPAPHRPSFAALVHARTPPQAPGGAVAHSAVSALAAVDGAQARLDAVLAAARAGRTFTAAELIGLQAQAYRCAQTVDLASKLAEQGAQSVKQALNAQI